MPHQNVEFKARCSQPERVLEQLLAIGARSHGVDEQTDVYFRVLAGRLKLRRGRIENALIFYTRADAAGPRSSRVHLAELPDDRALDDVLRTALEHDVTVVKRRHILWLDNVKFHIDEVDGLGRFIEVEVVDRDGSLGTGRLHEQCEHYRALLGVLEDDLEPRSYSDLLRDR